MLVPLVFTSVSAESQKVPVVILFKEKPTNVDLDLVRSNFGEITRVYHIINGMAAKLPQDRIDVLKLNPRVLSVDPDVEVTALDLAADKQIRADQVWTAGDTGQGIPVAILDTGIWKGHGEFLGSDYKTRIALCHNELFSDSATCDDLNGHGTHVAGIVGAFGSGTDWSARGVAPEVKFYIDQVLDSNGSGSLSGIIAGIDWAVTNQARVISMSLGTNPLLTIYDKTKPNCDGVYPSMTTAVKNAVSAGVTVVAAAGNSGTSGLGAPACISSAIAVGAVDSTDTIASFSSRGGPMKDHGIVAPGVNIYSTWLYSGYNTLSGTSMATPHVAGTVALMLKTNPALTPSTVRSILFSTACTSSTSPACSAITGTPNTVYGYGRVDALRAYSAVVSPPTASLSLSANPSTITTDQSSTVTASTSDGKDASIAFSSNLAGSSLTPPNCNTVSGTCSVTFSSTMPGTATITASASGYTSAQTTVTVTSASNPSLSVSVTTDRGTYKKGQFVRVTVTVTSSGVAVSGATVELTVYYPSGAPAPSVPSQTTDSSGKARFTYLVGPLAPSGTYTATATASKTGYTSGTGSTTFRVR